MTRKKTGLPPQPVVPLPVPVLTTDQPALPAYVRAHWSKSKQEFYFRFEASTRMRKEGFPLRSLPLGTDLTKALATYNEKVLPLLKARRQNALELRVESGPMYGTLDWACQEFEKNRRFKDKAELTQKFYRNCNRLSCNHIMRAGPHAGRRFGDILLRELTPGLVDDFYDEFLNVIEFDKDGKAVTRERSGTARHCVHNLRTVINIITRRHGDMLHKDGENPFEGVYAPHEQEGPPAVTLSQLSAFVRSADVMGLFSVSAIVIFAWEMQARISHFPYAMQVTAYRGPHHEGEVLVRDEKSRRERYFVLYDHRGIPLYPALIERLDRLKGNRSSGPLFACEASPPGKPKAWGRVKLYEAVSRICTKADLPHLTLSQFRKGGLTEAGAAGLTTSQIMSQSMHLTEQTVQLYIEKNSEIAMEGQKRRILYRRKKAERGIDIVT